MRSIVPVLNSLALEGLPNLKDRIVFHVNESGHGIVWVDDYNAMDLLRANPMQVRVPIIILIKDSGDKQKALSLRIKNRFPTSSIMETDADKIVDELMALGPSISLVGKYVASDSVLKAIRYIYHNLDNTLTVKQIASELHMSKDKLEREFSQEVGKSVWRTVIALRLNEACRLLTETKEPISEVGIAVGIGDLSSFSRSFALHVGESPKGYRKTRKMLPET